MDITEELNTIKDQVERYLKKDIDCRNSDRVLYYRILREAYQKNEIGKPFEGIDGFDALFFQALWELLDNSPDKSSVKRVRARIQNIEKKYRSTIPEVIRKRKQRQDDFRDWNIQPLK